MSVQTEILEFRGSLNPETVDLLLLKLKKVLADSGFDKITGKRVYAIAVEILENILKYSSDLNPQDKNLQPFIAVTREKERIILKAGNVLKSSGAGIIARLIDNLNQQNELSLISLYEHIINRELESDKNSAGLGFITMRLKSGNEIKYSFKDISKDLNYFEIKISINKYIMRKLVKEPTSNTPGVFFDPDSSVFKIWGESRPFDVNGFYSEILNWFDDYSLYLEQLQENGPPVNINLDLEYFNSSSAKFLLDFCKRISKARNKGQDITVRWHHEENDLDMLEAGREMSRIVQIPFEYVQK